MDLHCNVNSFLLFFLLKKTNLLMLASSKRFYFCSIEEVAFSFNGGKDSTVSVAYIYFFKAILLFLVFVLILSFDVIGFAAPS